MLWIPKSGPITEVKNTTNVGGVVSGAGPGTVLTAGAPANTDGAVTEIISAASNVRDSWGIEIAILGTGSSAVASQACADILVGGATDDVLIAALICGGAVAGVSNSTSGPGQKYFFPLHIPAGVRIAATLSSVRGAVNAKILIRLYGGGLPPFRVGRKVTTYGSQINNSSGQAITVTASGGAASVTQLSASTSEDHFAFIPGFQVSGDTTTTQRIINLGIGIGASTEQRIGTWWIRSNADEDTGGVWPSRPALINVPSGTRLTMLASNSGTNDSGYDGLIYAVS